MKRLILLLALAVLAFSCTRPGMQTFRKSTTLMNTLVSITVVTDSPRKAEQAIDAAFAEIERLETLLSFWTEDSEIAKIKAHAGESPVAVSPDTLEIVERSLFISEKTGGAFDPTVGPVIRLWDFKQRKRPTDEQIAQTLPLVDYRTIETDTGKSTVFLRDARMSFDTGGIAKGFAADKAAAVLKQHGISGALISIAGDIRAFGRRANGEPWRIGIKHPRPDGRDDELIATVELEDEGVSTSGDYERFFIEDNIRYHHILDPSTGYPADRGCISVTVIAPEAVLTDGLSTGIFVMGPIEGLKLLHALGLEGLIIDSEGKRYITPGLVERLHWTDTSEST
jgi:thiamine biosynthesis lipoprotein